MLQRPALAVSELGLLLVGLVLATLGFVSVVSALRAGGIAFVGVFMFLLAGAGCLTVSLVALLGLPRSTVGRATLMAAGWLAATYPLSWIFTYFGSGYIAAVPVAAAGTTLALTSIAKN